MFHVTKDNMANMKKHSFIHIDFDSSVNLTKAQELKLRKWLNLAAVVMEHLVLKEKIIHPTWIKKATNIKVSVVLCGEAKMKKINNDFRGKNKVTDVLSFPTYHSL